MSFDVEILSDNKEVVLFKNIFNDLNSIILDLNKCNWMFWGRDNNDPESQLGYHTKIVENKNLKNHFVEATKKCIYEYFKINQKDINNYTVYEDDFHVRKWLFPVKGMPTHTDYTYNKDGKKASVSFTVCGYLNDDYEGGEFILPEHNWHKKPPAGSIIIFPSYTLHGVSDLVDKNRYMWTTFIYSKEEIIKARY